MYAGLSALVVVWVIYRMSQPRLYVLGFLLIATSCFLFALFPVYKKSNYVDDYLLRFGINLDGYPSRIMNFCLGLLLSYVCYQLY